VVDCERERQVVLSGHGIVQQRDRPLGLARQPRGVGGPIHQGGRLERQQGCPLVGGSRNGVGAALVGPVAGLPQRGRRSFVRADGGKRQVPGTSVGVAIRKRARERAVRGATLLGGGRAVHGRAHQDVTELDLAVLERDETRRLGREKLLDGAGERPLERPELACVAGGRDQERLARRFRQRARPAHEPLRDASRDRHRRVDRQVRQPCRLRGELEERQRIARSRRV
jgi:hypothetical protein